MGLLAQDPIQQVAAIASRVKQPLHLISPKTWVEDKAHARWEARDRPPNDALTDWLAVEKELEDRMASIQAENLAWANANEADIIAKSPEAVGKYVAVCNRTKSKILAANDDRIDALLDALQHPELLDLATREDLPAAVLPTMIVIGDP